MTNGLDPTMSRLARDEYSSLLRKTMKDFVDYTKNTYKKIFFPNYDVEGDRRIEIFAKSYSAKRLEQSLKARVSDDTKKLILRILNQNFIKGIQMAFTQANFPKDLRSSATGRFISKGTFLELANVNVTKVKSIQQNHLDRLKNYIASFIGGGSFTWNQFLREIKRLGKISNSEAERIARTEVVRTISIGQQTTLRKLGLNKWRWFTALDERVCPICGPFNGRTRDIGKPIGNVRGNPIYHPPAHPNCRCGMEGVA